MDRCSYPELTRDLSRLTQFLLTIHRCGPQWTAKLKGYMSTIKLSSVALAVLSIMTTDFSCVAAAAEPDARKSSQIVFYGEGRARSRDEQSYALLRKHGTSMVISGNGEQIPVDELQLAIKGDFIWFREGSRSYVIVDPSLLARVDKAWLPYEISSEELSGKIRTQQTVALLKQKRSASLKEAKAAMRELIDAAIKSGKAVPFPAASEN